MTVPNLACEGELEEVGVGKLRTEAGAEIPEVRIAYQRWGEFAGDPHGKNNVLLIEHAVTGDSNVADWWADLLGPGKALDTRKWCVIATNALGGCAGSTGPASAHPDDGRAWGSRFPALSIRDLVRAERQFLEVLGITQVHAIIGGSMGGARTLEWTLLYPESITAACVIAVSARASGWQIGIQSAQISAIERDPFWHGGDYYASGKRLAKGSPPRAGLPTSPIAASRKSTSASASRHNAARIRSGLTARGTSVSRSTPTWTIREKNSPAASTPAPM